MERKFRPVGNHIESAGEIIGEKSESVEVIAGSEIDKAFEDVADVFSQANLLEISGNETECKQAKNLKKEASSALGTFYKKLRSLSLGASLLLAGGYVAHANYHKKSATNYADGKHLDRGKLSASLAIVDTYISSDLVDTYNTCIDFLQARKDGKMSSGEIAFKEDMAQRIVPFGYSEGGLPVIGDLQRLKQIKNGTSKFTKEKLLHPELSMGEKISKSGRSFFGRVMGADPGVTTRVRVDMFRKYLGLEQYFNTIVPSEHKPSQSKDAKARYFQFNTQEVLRDIFSITIGGFKGKNFNDLVSFVQKENRIPKNNFTFQLGQYKAYVGFDKEKNQRYVSYYDVWDMDPPQLKKLGINVDQFNFPYEIYGRIYEKDFEQFLAQNPQPQAS